MTALTSFTVPHERAHLPRRAPPALPPNRADRIPHKLARHVGHPQHIVAQAHLHPFHPSPLIIWLPINNTININTDFDIGAIVAKSNQSLLHLRERDEPPVQEVVRERERLDVLLQPGRDGLQELRGARALQVGRERVQERLRLLERFEALRGCVGVCCGYC